MSKYLDETGLSYLWSKITGKLSDGSVSKVGTATVGGAAKPIYLSGGTPTACSSTVGGTTQPVYMSGGTIKALSTTIGSTTQPVYVSSGALTAMTGALATTYGGTGTTTGHIAVAAGTDTTSTASPAHGGTFTAIDSVTKDSYGHVTAVNTKTITLPSDNNTDTKMTQAYSTAANTYPLLASATAGITATTSRGATTAILNNGVYMNPSTGAVTATGGFVGALTGNADTATTATTATKLGSSTVGGAAKPIYLSSGTPTACSSTVGGTVKPVYMSAGTITAFSTTVGSASKPVYMSGGSITACSSTVGSATKPVYMNAGVITECSVDLTGVYKYQGSVATAADLPTSSTAGYVYNTEDTGMNYAWNGTAWDSLGISFDVATITTTEIDTICV